MPLKKHKYKLTLVVFSYVVILISILSMGIIENKKDVVNEKISLKNYYAGNVSININDYSDKIDYTNKNNPDYVQAIQAALNYARDNASDNKKITVYVPDGTYYITKPLYIYSNTTLELSSNATIIDRGSSHIMLIGNSTVKNCGYGNNNSCNVGAYGQWKNITVKGGTWNFNRKENGYNHNGFYFYHGENLNISNVKLINGTSHILNISGVKTVRINSITIKNQYSTKKQKLDITQEAIHLDVTSVKGEPKAFPHDVTPTQDVVIENSTFENILCGIGMHGIPWDANNKWVYVTKDYNYNTLNPSDYMKQSSNGYVSKYNKNNNNVEILKAYNLTIQNNKFKNVHDIALNLYAAKNVSVKSNQIYGTNMKAFASVRYAIATITGNSYIDGAQSKTFILNGNTISVNGAPTCSIVNSKNDKNKNSECYVKYYDNNYNSKKNFTSSAVSSKYTTFRFDPNGASCSNCNNVTVKYGQKNKSNKYEYELSLNKTIGTRVGYTFKGWYAHNLADDTWWVTCNGKDSWEKQDDFKEKNCTRKLMTNKITINTKFTNEFDKPCFKDYTVIKLNALWKENNIKNISISKKPTKLNYIQNYEKLNLTGGKLKITYTDNKTRTIDLTDKNVKVSGFDNSKVGNNQIITVKYGSQSTKFKVNILKKSVKSIKIEKKPTKLNYVQNYEKLNLTGGKLKITYTDNTTKTIDLTNKNVKVTGFDNSEIMNNKILTVEYGGKTTTFKVNIISIQG